MATASEAKKANRIAKERARLEGNRSRSAPDASTVTRQRRRQADRVAVKVARSAAKREMRAARQRKGR